MKNRISHPRLLLLPVLTFLTVFCQATRSFADSESIAILNNSPAVFYELNETSNPGSGAGSAVDSAGTYNGTYGPNCQNGYNNIAGPRPSAFSGFASNNWAALTSPSSAGSFVTCPAWNLNTNTITIMAWINPVAVVQWAGIVFCRDGTTAAGLSLNATTSGGSPELAYNWANDPNNWGWHSTLYAPLNQWSLVALVVTPTNATIYLNTPSGTASATHTYAHPVQNFDGITHIGQDSLSNPGRTFNGSVDEVAVFNHALSQAQLQAIYSTAAPPMATIDTTKTYQTIEGLGGATAFYAGWITTHPYKQEIYTNAFAGLNLSMLRLGDWYRYQTPLSGFDSAATEIVANANRVLGHPVPVYMSSWAPPAFLKSNGQVGNGGTLITNGNGGFDYAGFAQYWYDSIQAYQSNGVNLTWASIQNEPDWSASYDSCIFHPTEDRVNGTNYASYSKALDAVYDKLTNLPSPPKLLAPEPVHISYDDLNNYGATLNPNSFYGVAHHLYGDGGATGDSFISALSSAANVFPAKPHFMTEYGSVTDMIECANLIYNELTVEQVSGYNHWSLVWPGTSGGLIQIENPFASQSAWTNAPPGTPTQSHGWWYSPSYWSMKHFSYFINPGYQHVSATDNAGNVRTAAFLSPDGLRLVVVLINTSASAASAMNFDFGTFNVGKSCVYQTANPNYYFQPQGSLTNGQMLPPRSLTTVVLDQIVNVGAATNPSPVSGATGVALNSSLSWTPGSNAVTHAVYLGVNSNAVAQATPASPQFQGAFTTTNFSPVLLPGSNYFWRVDEIIGANTNTGAVWFFGTPAPLPLLSPWQSQNIGSVGVAGSASYNNGVFVLTGSGADIWNSSDAFRYAWKPVTGDCTIVARVTSVQNTDPWSKAGVMIRESLNANAANAFIAVTPGNGVTWQYRSSTGGNSSYNNMAGPNAPYWVKLVRTGNTFTGYLSPDGVTWSQLGTATFTMASTVYLGLAVTSHNNSSLCLVTFDNVTAPNWPLLPGAPRNLTATADVAKVALTWAATNGVISYNIKRSTFSGGPYAPLTNVTTTAYTDDGLVNGTTYFYVVSAVNVAGESGNGAEASATPLAPPSLAVSLTGTNLVFSWPVANDGFTLLSCTNLESGNWVPISSPAPQIVGNQWQVTLPLSGDVGSMFYHLSK